MAMIIDGKAVAAAVREGVKEEVKELRERGVMPCLAVILVGDDAASEVYVNNKKKACEALNIESREYRLPASTSEKDLLFLIQTLNEDEAVHGILCQMPVPKHINPKAVIEAIDPCKDVDAFHPVNVGKIVIGDYDFLPCTPAGVMELIKAAKVDVRGKRAVVIGRSDIVGKPMAMLLLHADATVTVCHSKTENLAAVCREADILVSAVGKAKFVTADMVKEGAAVLDVGMNRDENGKLCGDVDFEAVKDKCTAITPVPGGVGPMTIAMLMKNTVTAARRQAEQH